MQLRNRYIILALICIGVLWFIQNKAIVAFNRTHNNTTFQQLKSIGKLNVWDQDFLLRNIYIDDKAYTFLSDAVISGKIGLDIDLADSAHTNINYDVDTLVINAQLQLANINYDAATLLLIGDAANSSTINLSKRRIFKYLDHKALEQYLPLIKTDLQGKPLTLAEQKLKDLTGKLVRIKLTRMPQLTDWN